MHDVPNFIQHAGLDQHRWGETLGCVGIASHDQPEHGLIMVRIGQRFVLTYQDTEASFQTMRTIYSKTTKRRVGP